MSFLGPFEAFKPILEPFAGSSKRYQETVGRPIYSPPPVEREWHEGLILKPTTVAASPDNNP